MNILKVKWVILALIFVAAIATVAVSYEYRDKVAENTKPAPVVVATTTPDTIKYTPYGKVILKVGETVKFSDSSVKLTRVFDDSRCPTGVTCIWAGTVNIEVEIFDGSVTTKQVINLGKSVKTKNQNISFVSATPYPKQDVSVLEKDYVITLEVLKISDTVAQQPIVGKCYVGGCSSEVCSDRPDVVSTCIYRPDYGCYQKAKCERQTDGKCGWTKTEELKVCLQTATM